MPDIGDDYRDRLASWIIQEQKRTGLTDRDFAERLGISYGTPYFWRSRKLKRPLSDESIGVLAKYRGESPTKTREWLEGRVPDSQLGLAEEVEILKQRLAGLEQLLSKALKNMKAPKSIADLLRNWMIREGLSQLELELQVATIGLISPERIREIQAGLPANQITDDDLAVIGGLVVKPDGTDYNLVELRAIRDKNYSDTSTSEPDESDCENSSGLNHRL